ncbi:probable disease resistance protein At4g27220 [Spinacia oleracea]|uniref:Probable disease resistance protein At4g27220 n=1 Tax=Spinacia oleracea TaxID=3562 RepID=A0ABM3RGV6_SPIOL|nr:probable disease resistance protein At4g27220 [Spinacia oleracea]
MEISHDLETELYRSIEANISAAASVPGPGDKNALKPEVVSPSSPSTNNGSPSTVSTDIHVPGEAFETTEHSQMSHDLEAEFQMSEPSLSEFLFGQIAMKSDVRATSSVEINNCVQNEAVDRFSFQAEISGTEEVLSLPKVNMKRSIHCTLEKIFEAFQDSNRRRIGVYGRGGSGKTTMLKNLFHHSATKELFDQVLFALVDGKFLVLLDDVWESINLHEVGIPNPDPENSCWLVLATRSLDICNVMADREIEMEVLSDAEALELFYCQLGDIIDSPEIKSYAQAISKECYGSSVIISAIGSALREENSIEQWKLALRNLQSGDTASTNDHLFFNPHIKYCYDRLKARDVKNFFLYTALFQQDKEIDSSMLVDRFISEGLVGRSTVAAYKKGHDIVVRLTNASLLEANDDGLMVKMHNVVRDSALEILSSGIEGYQVLMRFPESDKDEDRSFHESSWANNNKLVDKFDSFSIQMPRIHKYLTRAGAHLKESPSPEEWEQATMMFLMDNELSSLPSNPRCYNLIALFLQRNSSLRVIPTSFFDSMSTLKILNLSKTRIKSLPDSFSRLKSLQVLLLRDCERLLVLPSSIGFHKSLKVLDLQGTEVTHLPDSIGKLESLKQLRVSFYGSINRCEYNKLPSKLVSDGIISSLKLRELGVFVYPGDRRWTLSASGITNEISSLKLYVLYFHFPKVENLEHFVHTSQSWKARELAKFNFIVGHDFKRIVSLVSNDAELLYNEGQRCLRFVNGESIPDPVVEVLTRATSFYLDHHLNISNLSQFGIDCFDGLKFCILRDCPELVGILDSQDQRSAFLPFLEYLSINYLWNLKRIWVGYIAAGSFARLRCLSIHACPKLSYVLTCPMLDILRNLEELVIEDCVSLKYVVSEDEDVKEIKYADVDSVSALELSPLHMLKVLKLHYLPEMCGIWRTRWPPLEYVSFYDCPKLRNLHMEGYDDTFIKEIAADKGWWDSLEWDDLELSRRLLKHVTELHVDEL